MALRRLWYLVAVLGSFVFYIAYGEWMAWVLLVTVLGCPWLSLLLSLPGMLGLRLTPVGPDRLPLGEKAQLLIQGSSILPMPPFRGKLRLTHCLSGETRLYDALAGLEGAHCGGITVTIEKAKVYDYLGLFAFPLRRCGEKTILIPPQSLPMTLPEEFHRRSVRRWKPKFGGGFAENHELRLYRPGDNLNQVHWKLTAKTGKLILREPMEPEERSLLVTMTLGGSEELLDRKLGRLLWLGDYLLEKQLPFRLQVLTGDGILSFSVTEGLDLTNALNTLLCTPAVTSGSIRQHSDAASWQLHIGGDEEDG